MNPSAGNKAPSAELNASSVKTFLAKLRKRHIIETFAGFIAGGWLFLEFVDRILVAHYELNKKWLDVTFFTLLGALIGTLLWRWFSGREKPRKFKLELVLIPLVVLITVLLDIKLLLHMKGPEQESIPVSKWKNSIAVLPFVDMSPQKDQEYFCDGITEDLINRLSNIRDLKVPARTSAFMFKGKSPDMHEVGEKLKVANVLEGSVQKSGDRLRITAQLINIADGYHLWSEKYDRGLKEVFSIQDEITSAIVNALRLKLTSQEKQSITKHPIENIAAYECYLKANHEIWRSTKESIGLGIQYLQNALDTIGDNAILYSGLALANYQYVNIGVEQEDGLKRAEEYIRKTLALDPESSKAYAVLGLIYSMFRGNQREGVRYLKRALAINPDDPEALSDLAIIYVYYTGKIAEARPLLERLMRVDPLNQNTVIVQGAAEFYDGRYRSALDTFTKAYRIDPTNPWVQFSYSWALAYNKRPEEAFLVIDQAAKMDANNTYTKCALLLKYALQQDKKRVFRELTPEFARTGKRDAMVSYCISVVMALLRENGEALDWLENAVSREYLNYPMLAEKDPFLANIRSEPRFKKLMERVKYEWEHFEI